MKMQIAHTGRTGKDTSITFDTGRKVYCRGREEKDVYIYAEQTKDVLGVIEDLKKIGYREISREDFQNNTDTGIVQGIIKNVYRTTYDDFVIITYTGKDEIEVYEGEVSCPSNIKEWLKDNKPIEIDEFHEDAINYGYVS